jgi:hypothetical protein
VSGNVTAGNIIGTVIGNISNAEFATSAATVTTNAQPNITSVGTLSSLTVTANISTNGNLIVVGNVEPGNIVSTGLIRAVTIQATGNLVGGNANISNSVNTLLVNAANITAGNISSVRITTTGNITSSGNISGNYFIGNGSQLTGVISSYGNSNVAAYLPNYTGNISAGNIAVAQDMTVVGSLTAGTIQGTFVGNISGNLVVPGSNTWVIYNNAGSAGAESSFRYDSAIDTVIVTGTANIVAINSTDITATGNITGNLTTAAQPNITSVGTLGSLNVTGNITGGNVSGAGAGLSALTGANVTGTVANATSATTAGTVTTAAQPNITSVGTLTSITSSGNIAGANVSATGNVTGSYILGNASGLTSLTGANVTGTVANATYSITADTVANATQSNITSVGTLVSLSSSGNITGANLNAIGNVTGGNVISTDFMKALTIQATGNLTGGNANIINSVNAVNGNFTNVAATITTAAQPYITSLGTLANLSVTGNIVTPKINTPIVSLGTISGSQAINVSAGSVQTLTTSGNITLSFTNWPASGTNGSVTLVATVANSAHKITGPLGIKNSYGIVGLNYSTGVMSFPIADVYTFTFSSSDAGSTITINENNTILRPYNTSTELITSSSNAAISIGVSYSIYNPTPSSTVGTAYLGNGVTGQVKIIGSLGTSTWTVNVPASTWGGSNNINFNAAGQNITLIWSDVFNAWFILNTFGAVTVS